MTWSVSSELNPRRAFTGARERAKARGVPWNLSFLEWWQLWEPHWRRKSSEQLVLARFADWGPYERGNCRVTTRAENNQEKCRVTKIVNRVTKNVT